MIILFVSQYCKASSLIYDTIFNSQYCVTLSLIYMLPNLVS